MNVMFCDCMTVKLLEYTGSNGGRTLNSEVRGWVFKTVLCP